MASGSIIEEKEPLKVYERMLVSVARAMFGCINATDRVEELQQINDSKVFEALLDDWDNHQWEYAIDCIDDFTLNLGEWLVLKMDMLKPTKREIREQTQVTRGVIEDFAEDLLNVLEPLGRELGISKETKP